MNAVAADDPNDPEGQGKNEKPSKQSKGGHARAKKMTPEERSAAASKGASARWGKEKGPLPRALYTGTLRIGDVEFACAVLEGGVRVLTESSFMTSMGMYYSGWIAAERRKEASEEGSAVLPLFASQKSIQPFIDSDLRSLLSAPLKYRTESGSPANGVRAEIIPKICNVWLKARDAAHLEKRKLPKRQALIAQQADLLMRGLAEVGILALIDEATGYQYARPRKDLEKYLEKFLSENLRKWVRTFPSDYFKHLCRLRGVELRADMRLPQYFGGLTNNLIYRRIAPGLLRKLKDRKSERGSTSNKLHSWLSEDVGVREILLHLGVVVGLMKIHTNYDEFVKQLDSIAAIYPKSPGLYDDPADWDDKTT